ncbi:MAG: hypothetical protein OXH75_25480 [Acidobacteria bacterium]|nr:hypothetical protein [Acidobacteriota bacterium]
MDAIDFARFEVKVRDQALRLAARLVEQRLNRDRDDHAGATLACVRCGGDAGYEGRREKTVVTVLGTMQLTRAYYRCATCRKRFCSRDRALAVVGTSLSPGVVRMTGSAAARVSFAETSALLHDLAGVRIEAKQAERVAEALGEAIGTDEQVHVGSSRAMRRRCIWAWTAPGCPYAHRRLGGVPASRRTVRPGRGK